MTEIAISTDRQPIDVPAVLISDESAILSKSAESGLATGGVLVGISQRISIVDELLRPIAKIGFISPIGQQRA